jgi:hypothetical protein
LAASFLLSETLEGDAYTVRAGLRFTPTDLPDGLIFRIRVKWPLEKYFAFTEIQITYMSPAIPLHKGRFAIVTDVGSGTRWTHRLRKTSAAGSGRRNRVVLISRR